MSRTWSRVLLALLAVPNLIAGVWAIAAPEHWYDNFPGWAPRLVAAIPPYNEHLATDAGAGLLTIGLLAAVAAIWHERIVVLMAMVGFLAFSVPHALFHVLNPADALSAGEDIMAAGTLVVSVIVAAVVTADQWRTA